MNLIGRGTVWAARARGARLRAHSADPRASQEAALRNLLGRAARTAFGERHRFARIDGPAAFRSALPLHRHEDLEPWFDRARQGEPDVSWPGVIRYFGTSSGATLGDKYVPISRDSIRQQQHGSFEPIASYLRWTGDHELLTAKALVLGSTNTLDRNGAGVWYGPSSGIMARHVPRAVRRHYLPSPQARAIRDWDVRLDAIALESIDADVRLLAGTPSWFAGLFDRLLSEAQRRGRRARHVHDVWPNLSLMTGSGVAFAPYRRLLRARLGRHVPYVDVYKATAGGIMGVQDQPSESELLLLPDTGVYYEFVPLTELSSSAPRRFSMWEVEVDVVYALAVSTMSGIFSYLNGDCVRFVEVFPHRFVFEGRTAACLNVCGEHVSQAELELAVRGASHALQVMSREFTVSADMGVADGAAVRHVFLIEFDGRPPELQRLAKLIDGTLSDYNDDYRVRRRSVSGLREPEVRALGPGSFERWMRKHSAPGECCEVPRVLLDAAERAELEGRAASPADPLASLQ